MSKPFEYNLVRKHYAGWSLIGIFSFKRCAFDCGRIDQPKPVKARQQAQGVLIHFCGRLSVKLHKFKYLTIDNERRYFRIPKFVISEIYGLH